MLQRTFLSLLCFLLVTCTTIAQKKTEILWDNWGVPHVYAPTEEAMYHAFGWTQMHNHANLLLQLYGQARGRAAEYWGQRFVDSDRKMRLFNIPDTARAQYGRMDRETKKFLDAFVAGINAYAGKHPEAIDSVAKRVLPITPADVLAHSKRIICLEFLASDDISGAMRAIAPGSNAYAIAPKRSASGNAMLVTNPHLPWGDYFIFFEAHLTAPGFNAYGVSLIGQPGLNIAFNDHLGWTHTVNTIDASDRYELALQEGGYLLDGTVKQFDKKESVIKVRQADGSIRGQSLTLSYSAHGPVVGEKNGKAYAIRIAGMENAGVMQQWHRMAKAKSWAEFESAIKMLQNPMFNIIYADKKGNILYFFNGNVPRRSEGDWTFWSATVDGTQSKYIWKSYHKYEELPKVFNPATGWVQNANDAPWTSTYPVALDPKKFPAYMSPQETPLRPQRAINLVKDDASITFDELVSYKLNTGMEAADRFLPELLKAVEASNDTLAKRAAAVLQRWDRATNTDSRGAVLFARWADGAGAASLFAVPWNPAEPVTTPRGLKDPAKAVALLSKVAADVRKAYGALDIPWGDVNRFKVGKYDLPANGGSGNYGIFRTMYFQRAGDGKGYAFHGDTYVAVTEFGPTVRAQVLLSYGNATQPGNKHVGDQLPLLSEKKLRTALLKRGDVEKVVEERSEL